MASPMMVICPGQGAQAVGMGGAWARESEASARIFARADELLGDRLGAKLSAICAEGPDATLNRTDVSQPAIYTTGVAALAGICEREGVTPDEFPLSACAGLSLGEYTALHVAGAISFEDGLELVTLRGRAMQDAAEASPSGMLALVGADEDSAGAVCEEARGADVLVCANFNAPGQVVLSGSVGAIDRAEKVAADRGLRSARLAVAGAFHSPLMAPAAERLRGALDSVTIREPRCPVWSNVTGQAHGAGQIARRLVEQLTSPVRWSQGCAAMIAGGLHQGGVHELAPGKTLAGLMRRIDRDVKVVSHDTP